MGAFPHTIYSRFIVKHWPTSMLDCSAWYVLRYRAAMSTQQTTMNTIENQLSAMVPEWTALFKALKADIADDYRASDDPDDNTPGMCVTIGFTPESEEQGASWSYQTGDNSYTGGAYGHPHWSVVSLYRRSNSRELAEDCANQIADLVS